MADPTARDGEIIDAAELKRTKALLKMAERHAMNCDANQAAAEAKLARAEARHAGLNAHHLRTVADHQAELDALKAAIEPVCERLDWLIANGFGARTADLQDLRAALDAPESPAVASTAVSAATEAHGGAGEAQEARE